MNKKVELLSPAGDFERLKIAPVSYTHLNV